MAPSEEPVVRMADHFREGARLTREEADQHEHLLLGDPGDLVARIRLLASLLGRSDEPGIAERVRTHALWFVAHHPELDVIRVCNSMLCYHGVGEADHTDARRLWNEHLARRSDDPLVLAHAAHFFSAEDPARAVALMRQAVEAETRPEERRDLTKRLARELVTTDPDEALELLLDLRATESNGPDGFELLMEVVEVALCAGDLDATEAHALELLERTKRPPRDWNHGNGVNCAHEALGWIALERGDVPAAARALVASSDVPKGAPHMPGGDRPRLDLARELLARGERQAVVEFLENAARFWHEGRPRHRGWVEALLRGESPDLVR